jgi:hypothetical protein
MVASANAFDQCAGNAIALMDGTILNVPQVNLQSKRGYRAIDFLTCAGMRSPRADPGGAVKARMMQLGSVPTQITPQQNCRLF